MTKVTCFSFSLDKKEPMAYLRLVAPLREAEIDIINGFSNRETNFTSISETDIIVFQREFPSRFNDYQKIVDLAQKNGKPIVFEVDDLLFLLPKTHPDRNDFYFALKLLPMFQALTEADLVTVSSKKLADTLLEFNPNVIILPNYFDDHLWEFLPPKKNHTTSDKLTIGYMGTNSHQPDLAFIAPVLTDLLKQYPEILQIHVWGTKPPSSLIELPQVQWTSPFFSSYEAFGKFFLTQSADIFVAPLVTNLFNSCKSSVKFFEYSALGAPGVYSRIEPYENIIKHGHNGLLASSLDEWQQYLVKLIQDQELRYKLASKAQDSIQRNWLLSENAYKWNDAYRDLINKVPTRTVDRKSFINFLTSFNQQLFEAINEKEAIEKSLRSQVTQNEQTIQLLEDELRLSRAEVVQLENKVVQLENEVVQYALSKSWRYTRPFRKIDKKFKRYLGVKNG
jgi:glycosyltransferase involved in cell wall biosynthesis